MEEQYKCGCVNYGDYKFKLCSEHRDLILDNENAQVDND